MKSNLTSLLSKDRTLCLALVPKDFLLFPKSFMILYFSFICWKGYLFYIDCFCAFVRNLLDIFVWVFLWVKFIDLSKEIIVYFLIYHFLIFQFHSFLLFDTSFFMLALYLYFTHFSSFLGCLNYWHESFNLI